MLSDKTLFTGQYQTINDTTIFNLDNREKSNMYHYTINNDILKLNAIDQSEPIGNLITLDLMYFLWAYSFLKRSGNFIWVE